jgi:hypothetical protein
MPRDAMTAGQACPASPLLATPWRPPLGTPWHPPERAATSLDATAPRHYTSAVSNQQRRRSRVAVVAT